MIGLATSCYRGSWAPRRTQLVDESFDIGIRESWTKALEDVKAKGGKPYAIPAGASVHKLGGLGYVGFAEEVRAQEKEMDLRFDYVIVCTVTGSTHAGMVVGFAADGRQRNVIGIDASCTPLQTKAQVLDIAQKTSELVGGKTITAEDIVLNEEYDITRSTVCPRRRPWRQFACLRGWKA